MGADEAPSFQNYGAASIRVLYASQAPRQD